MDEQRILDLFDGNRSHPGGDWEILEYAVRSTSDAGAIRGIYHSRFPPERLDVGIEEQKAHFASLGIGFEWKVYAHDTPANLRDKLVEHGFHANPAEAFLVREVGTAAGEPLQASLPVRVVRLESLRGWDDYRSVVRAVHGRDASPSLGRKALHSPEKVSIYVAYAGSEPVAAGRIDYDDEHPLFANLSGGATLPAFRRRGIYSALVHARLEEARARGIPYAYVDALPTSEPILRAMGFQRLSTIFTMTWEP